MNKFALLLILLAGTAFAQTQAPEEKPKPDEVYFILAGTFLPCPLNSTGMICDAIECPDSREGYNCNGTTKAAWADAVRARATLKALTSQGRSITVKLLGFRHDDELKSDFPQIEPPVGLLENERVLLIWNTADNAQIIEPRPYQPTPEQAQFAQASSTMAYMPERWEVQNFGPYSIGTTSGMYLDPSKSANLRIRYSALEHNPTFFLADVAAKMENDNGEQYFVDHRSTLFAIDIFRGEYSRFGIVPPYFYIKFRNQLLLASQYISSDSIEVGLSTVSEGYHCSGTPSYCQDETKNKRVIPYLGKQRVVPDREHPWSASAIASFSGWDTLPDEYFHWPDPPTPIN